MSWHNIRVEGIGRIERIVAVFQIWAPSTLPFPKFKVKIVEGDGNSFTGFTNVTICHPQTGHLEWIAGTGGSVEAALTNTLHNFLREIDQNLPDHPLCESDFAWSAPEDF